MKALPVQSVLYFTLSTIITWWFIVEGKQHYSSQYQMYLSCAIAGGKWMLQIIASLIWLGENKWKFIHRISLVCLAGSILLIPYAAIPALRQIPISFLLSLLVSVAAMVFLYWRAAQQSGAGIKWFAGWIGCLIAAIFLQLTIVFHLL